MKETFSKSKQKTTTKIEKDEHNGRELQPDSTFYVNCLWITSARKM